MREYGWWHEDEDYEGYLTDSDNYTPGSVAYNWLVWRVSSEMPTDSLMEAAELLDEIFYHCRSFNAQFTSASFKLILLFDADLRGLVLDFIRLVKNYTFCEHLNLKQCVSKILNLIYSYLNYRDAEVFPDL
jgi:hypothetical protein